MRVAIVQQHVDVRRGGAETSTIEMARRLAELGLDVTLVCRGPLTAEAARATPRAGTALGDTPGAATTSNSPACASRPAPADVRCSSGYTVPVAPPGFAPFLDGGVEFHPLQIHGMTRALRTYRFVRAADRFCRSQQFDIVHAVTPCLAANIYQPRGGTYPETIARTLARTRSPIVRLLRRAGRSFNLSQRFLFWLEQTLLIKYAPLVRVAALSDYVRRQVLTGFEFPPARVRIVFNGVEIELLAGEARARERARLRGGLGLADDVPLVLFAAHNFRLKGLAELLRAMASVARFEARVRAEPRTSGSGSESAVTPLPYGRGSEGRGSEGRGSEGRGSEGGGSERGGLEGRHGGGWQLVVAGRDRAALYARLARRLGLAAQVHFVGTKTPIRAWYAAADVLAHPTWYDPCSRVVLEALSVGLPVVTTRWNGAAEVMECGRHGDVIDDPADTAALAAALVRSLAPAVRAACAADAPRMAERLSMARHARELAGLYDEVRAKKA